VIIVAALVALIQGGAARMGSMSPLTATFGSAGALFENLTGAASLGMRSALKGAARTPHLTRENAALQAKNAALARENAMLQEQLAAARGAASITSEMADYPHAVPARVIGYPPENESLSVTVNRGSRAGISRDDGVMTDRGAVGRVYEAGPIASKVVLITDYTSSIPAMVQRGRWWGVAKGNLTSVRLEFVSQDAPIRVGDQVVTGEARSFHSGIPIGTIVRVDRSATGLYQTAIVKPAADLASLDHLVILPK